jgi:hypothetical protein
MEIKSEKVLAALLLCLRRDTMKLNTRFTVEGNGVSISYDVNGKCYSLTSNVQGIPSNNSWKPNIDEVIEVEEQIDDTSELQDNYTEVVNRIKSIIPAVGLKPLLDTVMNLMTFEENKGIYFNFTDMKGVIHKLDTTDGKTFTLDGEPFDTIMANYLLSRCFHDRFEIDCMEWITDKAERKF